MTSPHPGVSACWCSWHRCCWRRRRRDRHDLERHAGVLQRLQPGPPLDRRQALPLPVRQPRPRPARARARRREQRRDRRRDRPRLAAARRPLLRVAQRGTAAARPARSASRCTTSAGERRRHDPTARRCRSRQLQAAARRDARAPSGGVASDAESEAGKEPTDYLHRLGLERRDGGHFLLGAWRGKRLLGRSAAARGAREGAPHRPRDRHDGPAGGARRRASAPCSSRPASARRATPGSRC